MGNPTELIKNPTFLHFEHPYCGGRCNAIFLERGRALREGYGFHTGPKNPIMALISEYMLTADRLICTHARYNS